MKIQKMSKIEIKDLKEKLKPIFEDLGLVFYKKIKEKGIPLEGFGFRLDIISKGSYQWFASAYGGTPEMVGKITHKMRSTLLGLFKGWLSIARNLVRRIVLSSKQVLSQIWGKLPFKKNNGLNHRNDK